MIISLLSCYYTGVAASAAGASTVASESSYASSIIMIFIFIISGLAVITGLVVLQIFLSKAQSKWPGLVLPGCSIFISLSSVLGYFYMTIAGTSVIFSIIAIFLVFNIPTIVYLVIYKVVRSNRKNAPRNNQEIQKMNIQDLE